MKYVPVADTGIKVSELCFGVLPMGPLQANLPVSEGADLLLAAMENGVNFFDTAQMYKTYPYLKRALDNYHGEVVITSKSVAEDYQGMEKAVQEALRELGRDYIDIFLLHAAKADGNVVEQRPGAWQCLLDYKQKGHVRALGVSTHTVGAMKALAAQPGLDVLFPLINKAGLGLLGGTPQEMAAQINLAAAEGKFIYSMKLLGGGVLIEDILAALAFGRNLPGLSAHAVGMIYLKELMLNLRIFNDENIDADELKDIKLGKTWLLRDGACKHCGRCVTACHSDALTMDETVMEPRVDYARCLLCGYCAVACPEFAIRVK